MRSTERAEAHAHLPDPAKPSANRSSRKRLTKTAHLLIARPTRYRSIVRSSMVRCWLSTFLRPTDRGCRETISRDAPISSPLGLARAPTHISLVFVTAYRRQCGHTPSSPKKTVAQGAAPERRRDPPWHAWKRDTPRLPLGDPPLSSTSSAGQYPRCAICTAPRGALLSSPRKAAQI